MNKKPVKIPNLHLNKYRSKNYQAQSKTKHSNFINKNKYLLNKEIIKKNSQKKHKNLS